MSRQRRYGRMPHPSQRPGRAFVNAVAKCTACRVSHPGCTIRQIATGDPCCETCQHPNTETTTAHRVADNERSK